MPPLPLHCRYIPVTDSSGAVRGVLLAANKVGAEGFVPEDEAAAKSAAAFVGAVLARCARRLNDPSDVAVLHIQELQVRWENALPLHFVFVACYNGPHTRTPAYLGTRGCGTGRFPVSLQLVRCLARTRAPTRLQTTSFMAYDTLFLVSVDNTPPPPPPSPPHPHTCCA